MPEPDREGKAEMAKKVKESVTVSTATEQAPTQTPAFLTDEQIETMSDAEIQAYFERMRAVAQRRNIVLPGVKVVVAGGASFDSVLSRAGIMARAKHALDQARARFETTETQFNAAVAAFLSVAKREALTEEEQARINTHSADAVARAQKGYEKLSEANKGKKKGRTSTLEARAEGAAEGETQGDVAQSTEGEGETEG